MSKNTPKLATQIIPIVVLFSIILVIIPHASASIYESLARGDDEWIGKDLAMDGRVLQVTDTDGGQIIRLATEKSEVGKDGYGYGEVYYLFVPSDVFGFRLLEDDLIVAHFEYEGLYSYESISGEQVTLPSGTVNIGVMMDENIEP